MSRHKPQKEEAISCHTALAESDVRQGPSLVELAAEVDPDRYERRLELATTRLGNSSFEQRYRVCDGATGEAWCEGQAVLVIEAGAVSSEQAAAAADTHDLDHVRADLAELQARLARTLDANRSEKVAKRHGLGHRTARENVDDLCDAGSFVEYGQMMVAAQRQRRALDDLIDNTPADGLVAAKGGR